MMCRRAFALAHRSLSKSLSKALPLLPLLYSAAVLLVLSGLMAPAAIAGFGSSLSMREAHSKLSNLDEFPLFLPDSAGKRVASSEQLSPTDISEPSLAWIRDQVGKRYGSDRLVTQWQAYQIAPQLSSDLSSGDLFYVDVVVDEQIWGLLSYFERYAFIAHFGTVAKQYGYHLRVFHSGDVFNHNDAQASGSNRFVALRGAHVCNFQPAPTTAPTPLNPGAASEIPCEIVFNEASRRQAP